MNSLISGLGLGGTQGTSSMQGMQGLMGLLSSIMQLLQKLTQGQGQQQAQNPQQLMQQLAQALQNPQQAQQQNPQFAQQLQQLSQLLQQLQGAAQQQGAPQNAQQAISQLLQQVQAALQQLGVQPAQQGAGGAMAQNPFNQSNFTTPNAAPVAGITSTPAARQAITSSLLAPVTNDPTLQGMTPSQQISTLQARCNTDLGVINSHDSTVTSTQKTAAIKDLGAAEQEMERIQMATKIQGQRIQGLN
jgi:hypothetical protein